MEINIIKQENLVYEKPRLMNDRPMHYCPGCSHGVVHKLIAEVIDEMGMEEKTIGVAPVGCAVFAYNYLDIDWQEAAHGRAPALATAIKRLSPDKMVFTYQGDGDLAAIGTAETIHACNRGKYCDCFHQQCNLRNDRRSNGSYHASGYENIYLSPWTKHRTERLSLENIRLVSPIRRYLFGYSSVGSYGSGCQKGEKNASESIRKLHGRKRNFRSGICIQLPFRMETDAGTGK